MNRIAGRAKALFLLVCLLLGGFGFFVVEYFMNGSWWAVFSGSPHVYHAGNIGTGVVVDRDNILLLDMNSGREYSGDETLRKATLHWLGDRQGNISAPALGSHSQAIAGFDVLNGLYTYGQIGAVEQLTLSAAAQMAALEAMGGKKGTVAVYNYKTGEILCAVTTPTFDPDHVPDIDGDTTGAYEGTYLNRFTQVSYTPGSIFKVVTAGAVLESDPALAEEYFTCTGSYQMGVDSITCERAHGTQDLKLAFLNSCNCVFAQIAQRLGGETMTQYVNAFRVNQSVSFDGITTAKGNYEVDESAVNVAWSAVGQYKNLVNPCVYLTFVGAVANGGTPVQPYVVQRITNGGIVTYNATATALSPVMSPETAVTLQEYMRNNVANKYGDGNFAGLTVCAKTGTAEVGDHQRPNAMFCGFVQDDEYPLAFIVCVEDGGYGGQVCIPIAARVLAACKAALDGV